MTELVRTYKLTDSGAWGWVTEEAEGGGGGSLPDWWTVDSTPGSESVSFAGIVEAIAPAGTDPSEHVFRATSVDLSDGLFVRANGTVFIEAESTDAALAVEQDDAGGNILSLIGPDGEVGAVGPTGAVTVSPSDDPSGPTALKIIESADTDDNQPYMLDAVDRNANHVLRVDRNGAVLNLWSDTFGGFAVQDGVGDMTFRVLGGGKIGFFAANPVIQPTGVAVDAAGIHAALVTLGLIAA